MDAKELTKYAYRHDNEIIELKKQVEFLTQEYEKFRILVDDMRIDIQMSKNMQRR